MPQTSNFLINLWKIITKIQIDNKYEEKELDTWLFSDVKIEEIIKHKKKITVAMQINIIKKQAAIV